MHALKIHYDPSTLRKIGKENLSVVIIISNLISFITYHEFMILWNK